MTPLELSPKVFLASHSVFLQCLIQASLSKAFPTWESVDQNREVFAFACDLTADPEALLEVIQETWIGKEKRRWDDLNITPGLFRSKHVNQVDLDDPKERARLVVVPSRVYLFSSSSCLSDEVTNVELQVDPSASDPDARPGPAECDVSVGVSAVPGVFKLIQRISEHQELSISRLKVTLPENVESLGVPLSVLNISKNVWDIDVCGSPQGTSPEIIQWISNQLSHCDKLSTLSLQQVEVPSELVKAIEQTNNLEKVSFEKCTVNRVWQYSKHCRSVRVWKPSVSRKPCCGKVLTQLKPRTRDAPVPLTTPNIVDQRQADERSKV